MSTLVAVTDILQYFLFGCQIVLVVIWILLIRDAERYRRRMVTMHAEIDKRLDASTQLLHRLHEEGPEEPIQ